MNIEINVDSLKRLHSALQVAPVKVVEGVSLVIKKSLIVLQSNAIKEAPVNKQAGGGNLRQSIKSRMVSSLRGEVWPTALYALFVEAGTRPHIIRAVNKGGLANKRTGEFFGKVVHHPGTRANPFLKRAVEKSKTRIQGYFKDAVITVFENIKKEVE
ncbi:MAG: HK97-gp10 family putative phage morphogenesis protein [Minisyncoccia bacterium]